MKPVALALTAFLACLHPAVAPAADNHDKEHSHLAVIDGVRILHGWTRATAGGSALIFMEIENTADHDVVLTGAEANDAASAELVGFVLKDGNPVYETLPSVPIKPGRELHLEPDSLAIRLNGLKRDLTEGDDLDIEVEFDIGHVEIEVEIGAADATRHSHAGHTH